MTFRDFFSVTVQEVGESGFPDSPYPATAVFHFAEPPSREEFLEACRRRWPWTQVWVDTVFRSLAAGAWPILDAIHKRAEEVVPGAAEGLPRVKVTIARETFADNPGYIRADAVIPFEVEDREIKRLPRAVRTEANMAVMHAENHIREALLKLPPNVSHHAEAARLIRRVLKDAGLRKTP